MKTAAGIGIASILMVLAEGLNIDPKVGWWLIILTLVVLNLTFDAHQRIERLERHEKDRRAPVGDETKGRTISS